LEVEEETRVPEEIEAMRLVAANIIYICVYSFCSLKERNVTTLLIHLFERKIKKNSTKVCSSSIFVCVVYYCFFKLK